MFTSRYTNEDFESVGFHDCFVYGLSWDSVNFSVTLDLDYIVDWVKPQSTEGRFRFSVCRAALTFSNVDDVRFMLEWHEISTTCQIDRLRREDSRKTPNGTLQWHFELELLTPGTMDLWATDFELVFLEAPVLSDSQGLRGH